MENIINKIILKSGMEIDVNWAGVSTIDGYIRFGIPNMDMTEALITFSNKENTAKITYNAAGNITEWEHYTRLAGLNQLLEGETIITLAPEFPTGD